MITLPFLIAFSAISFLFFGVSCFVTPFIRAEFIRYGLSNKRNLVGTLQIFGALALVLGYLYYPVVGIIAAIGLALLMLLGFGVRLKIKDKAIQSAPSLLYAIINTYIAIVLIYKFF
jgi:hypothetical protein